MPKRIVFLRACRSHIRTRSAHPFQVQISRALLLDKNPPTWMNSSVLEDRYDVLEKLGEGGMAIVHRCRDRESGKDVAIKVMKQRLDGSAQKRFLREFRAVSSLQHPNCVQVYEFGESAAGPYFAMELFRGKPITHLHGRSSEVLLRALAQAASAVGYVHSKGIIHRDLKPSNLLAIPPADHGSDSQVQVKLTDFGLARFHGITSSLTSESAFVGTVQYSSPEQLTNSAVDYRSDLYSFGLVCYETLTGRYAHDRYVEANIQSILMAHLNHSPALLTELVDNVPAAISDFVMRLLEKNPEDRPDSAAELCEIVARQLGESLPPTFSVKGLSATRRQQVNVGFIGRKDSLTTVSDFLQQGFRTHTFPQDDWTSDDAASVLFISAEAGMGKTYVMNQAVRLAQRSGANVYQGRCFEGNPAPFQPIVEILRQLIADSRLSARLDETPGSLRAIEDKRLSRAAAHAPTLIVDEPPRHNTLRTLINDYRAEILRVAPELRNSIPGEAFQQLDIEREANYVLRALSTFFTEIGTLSPALICIDDLQWADASTLKLLRQLASALLRGREVSIERNFEWPNLAIICTVRTGDSPARALAQSLTRGGLARVAELSAFTHAETKELVARLLRNSPDGVTDSVVQQLHQMSEGNPFFVRELVNSSKLAHGDVGALSEQLQVRWPDSIKDALAGRLSSLSAAATKVVEWCSVVGPVVSVDLLYRLMSDMSEAELFDAIDELLSRKTLTESANGQQLQFSHDLLRELVAGNLANVRRKTLHSRVAAAMESMYADTHPEKLAEHYLAAGEMNNAFQHLVEAGDKCLRAYAVEDAVRNLKRAQSIASQDYNPTPAMKHRLQDLLATSLVAAGEPTGAIEQYESNLSAVADPLIRSRILERLGLVNFRIGNFTPAVEALNGSLGELGMSPPKSVFGVLASTGFAFGRYLLPARLSVSRRIDDRQRRRMTIALDGFNTLTYLWGQRDLFRVGHASGRQLVLARRLGEPARLATVYAQQALFCGLFSFNRLGMWVGARAAYYASMVEDPLIKAIVDGQIGCVHYFGGRLDDAERVIRRALTTLDRRGDSWFRLFFYHNLRHLYGVRGDASKELEAAHTEKEISETVRDPEGLYYAEYGIANALARTGEVAEARNHMAKAIEQMVQTNLVAEPTAWQTYGYVQIQSGNYHAAREALMRSHALIRKHWAYLDYAIRCYPLLVESILETRWLEDEPSIADADLRKALKLSKKAVFWCRRFPNYLPHALRMRGRAAFAVGDRRKAIDWIRSAVDASRQIGSSYALARSLVDLSRVSNGCEDDAEAQGRAILNDINATLPMGER